MKRALTILTFLMIAGLTAFAQPERVGQAGATQLLINSWARSTGYNAVDVSSIDGVESVGNNPAGMGTTNGTELVFSHTNWLAGSGIRINTFGVSQSLGSGGGVMGLSVMAFSLGDFIRTTEALPDGTLGTFSPSYLNLGISYARRFTEHIYVGTTIRLISESTPEVSSQGVAFDAGIQYRAGSRNQLRIGIALRNVGPTMKYAGDGLNGRVTFQPNNPYSTSVELPASDYELPSVLSLGASYEFRMNEKNHLTVLASFTSNAFYLDQIGVGVEYRYHRYLMLRAGYMFEEGIFGDLGDTRYNAYTGLATGATVKVPFKLGREDDDGNPIYSSVAIDFSYRLTNPFNGTFGLGARIAL